jgi:signal transduction histidine kinase
VRRTGGRRALPPQLDQAAFRILQESLTNAARHGAGRVEVAIAYGERALELTVTNPATTTARFAEGHGILGMRERATLLGGTLEVTRTDAFRIHTVLPYRELA